MRKPPLRVRFVGHPFIMVPVMGAGLFALVQWILHPASILLGVVAIAAMALVSNANQRRMEFIRWRRNWDAMADAAPLARKHFVARLMILIVSPLAVLTYQAGAFDGLTIDPGAIVVMAGGIIAAWAMIRWLRRRRQQVRPAPRPEVVRVCARPIMATPRINRAYAALPRALPARAQFGFELMQPAVARSHVLAPAKELATSLGDLAKARFARPTFGPNSAVVPPYISGKLTIVGLEWSQECLREGCTLLATCKCTLPPFLALFRNLRPIEEKWSQPVKPLVQYGAV